MREARPLAGRRRSEQGSIDGGVVLPLQRSREIRGVAPERLDPKASRAGARGLVVAEPDVQTAPAGPTASRSARGLEERRYVARLRVLDALTATAAGWLGYLSVTGVAGAVYLTLSLLFPLAWLVAVTLARGYEPRFLHVGSEEFRRVLEAGLLLSIVGALTAYMFTLDLARGYLLVVAGTATAGTLALRLVLRRLLHRQRSAGAGWMRRAVIVGHSEEVRQALDELGRQRSHGYEVAGLCVAEGVPGESYDVSAVVGLDDIPGAVERFRADAVIVLPCREVSGAALRRLGWQLEQTGTQLLLAPGLVDVAHQRATVHPAGSLPLLHIDHPEFTGPRRAAKQVFERAAAATAIVALSPVLLVLMAAVRLDSRGPAIFRQERVGQGDRRFTMFKLRTMSADAETRRSALLDENESDGALFKIREDPRVTRVGRVLRRYSLDELPQLFNVILGHMSLVGPRPPLPAEVDAYEPDVRRRLAVKPGLTGLWQVSGRSDLPWDEAVRLDLRYVDNWSPALDMSILWKTGRAVLSRSGAY